MGRELADALFDGPSDPTFRRRLLWAGFLGGVLLCGFLAQLNGDEGGN